jgi:hypothetical protein
LTGKQINDDQMAALIASLQGDRSEHQRHRHLRLCNNYKDQLACRIAMSICPRNRTRNNDYDGFWLKSKSVYVEDVLRFRGASQRTLIKSDRSASLFNDATAWPVFSNTIPLVCLGPERFVGNVIGTCAPTSSQRRERGAQENPKSMRGS